MVMAEPFGEEPRARRPEMVGVGEVFCVHPIATIDHRARMSVSEILKVRPDVLPGTRGIRLPESRRFRHHDQGDGNALRPGGLHDLFQRATCRQIVIGLDPL